tara:strand:- start:5194 stop:6186 length:993 start_codon:yes stop_codon:yes gene_type:complete
MANGRIKSKQRVASEVRRGNISAVNDYLTSVRKGIQTQYVPDIRQPEKPLTAKDVLTQYKNQIELDKLQEKEKERQILNLSPLEYERFVKDEDARKTVEKQLAVKLANERRLENKKRNKQLIKLKLENEADMLKVSQEKEDIQSRITSGQIPSVAERKVRGGKSPKRQIWNNSDDVIVEFDLSGEKTVEGSFNGNDIAVLVDSGILEADTTKFGSEIIDNYKYIFPIQGGNSAYVQGQEDGRVLRNDMIKINTETNSIEDLNAGVIKKIIFEHSKSMYGKNLTRPMNIVVNEELTEEKVSQFDIETAGMSDVSTQEFQRYVNILDELERD